MITARLEKRQIQQSLASIWVLEVISHLTGESFQIASANESGLLLEKLVESQNEELIIDLSNAKEFDSHGVQFLLMLHKELAPQSIPIILRKPNTHLRRVLRVMQVDRIFEFEDEADEENSSA